jgi:hypothetical protein
MLAKDVACCRYTFTVSSRSGYGDHKSWMEFLETASVEGVEACVGIDPPMVTHPLAIQNANEGNLSLGVIGLGVRHRDYADVEPDSDDESEVDFEVKQRLGNLQEGRKRNVTLLDVDKVEEKNVLFLLRSLVWLLANQYACKGCRTVNTMTMELETFGIASTLHLRCICGLASSAGAEMRLGRDDKVALIPPEHPTKTRSTQHISR